MNLGERIALLRKQAGLSQEQLGDKMGVSRQAVSKWESGQVNPDLQYIMALCRLFEVSADYLLFGEERGGRETPALCPGCGGVITALDEFCPRCGRKQRESELPYCLVRNELEFQSETMNAIYQIFRLPGVEPAFEVQGEELDWEQAQQLAQSGPMVLCRMNRETAGQVINLIYEQWASGLMVYRDERGSSAEELLDSGLELKRKDFFSQTKKEPMSFWGTVGAVALGVIAAMVLLMFL